MYFIPIPAISREDISLKVVFFGVLGLYSLSKFVNWLVKPDMPKKILFILNELRIHNDEKIY